MYNIVKQETEDYVVVKSNKLIQESKINLSIYEQRIINYMISKILPDDAAFDYITFDYKDFCRMCNIKDTNLSYVKHLVKNLYDKSVIVFDGTHYVPFKWLEDFKINQTEILLLFHKRMEDFLLHLRDRGKYTQSELLYYLQFTSRYTPIFYDYFKSYINLTFRNRERKIERILKINEIREKLLLENKYPLFKDLRVNVIEPSMKEINETTDLHIDFEYIKKGRKVDSIKFSISVRDISKRMLSYGERKVKINESK